MSLEILAVGVNHTTAPVELRERLATATDAVAVLLPRMVADLGLAEAMVLSTCNRVEIYALTERWAQTGDRVLEFLAGERGVPAGQLRQSSFVRGAGDGVRHIFRVAASLESMVVGEPQILGQVKDAFDLARRAGTVGAILDRCLTAAFKGAKRVRTETEIARGAASVPSVAVELARRIFGELRGCGVVLVGAGEMAEQAGAHLRAAGVSELTVVNRSRERGEALARTLDGHAAPWEQLEVELRRAEIVVTSTGASQPVIDRALMKRVMRARRNEPVFLVDIAVPRDVDADVARLDEVFLYNIDDLQAIVHDNMRSRVAEAERAATLVEEEVAAFIAWQRSRAIGPLIRELQEHARAIVEAELSRLGGKLSGLSPEQQKAVATLARGISQKLLHRPMISLRKAAAGDDAGRYDLASALQELFQLGDAAEPDAASETATPSAARPEPSS